MSIQVRFSFLTCALHFTSFCMLRLSLSRSQSLALSLSLPVPYSSSVWSMSMHLVSCILAFHIALVHSARHSHAVRPSGKCHFDFPCFACSEFQLIRGTQQAHVALFTFSMHALFFCNYSCPGNCGALELIAGYVWIRTRSYPYKTFASSSKVSMVDLGFKYLIDVNALS